MRSFAIFKPKQNEYHGKDYLFLQIWVLQRYIFYPFRLSRLYLLDPSILGDDTWVSIGTGIDLPCGFVGFEYLREYFKLRVHTPIHSSVLTIYSSLFGWLSISVIH